VREGKDAEALRSSELSLDTRHAIGISYEAVKESFVVAVEAALALDDVGRTEELMTLVEHTPAGRLGAVSPGALLALPCSTGGPSSRLQRSRPALQGGSRLFRELAFPFYLAVTLLEQGDWLPAQDRRQDSEPLLAEARDIFERLEARPWLDRTQTSPVEPEPETVTAGS
jgi:hypothetical protein